jgi:hypothetical protein
MAVSVLLVPLSSLGHGNSARAESNDLMGQAQRFMNNRSDDRDSYERGRDDAIRRQEAQRDSDDYRRDHDQDRSRDDRYRKPDYGYDRR